MIGNKLSLMKWLSEQDENAIFEITERKNNRTLTANSYYWGLINKLSTVMRISKKECHLFILERYGQFEVVSVRADVPIYKYFKYYNKVGQSELNGKMFNHYRIFKGSHEMDSKEFAALLDGLISECESVGIPTITSKQAAELNYIDFKERNKNDNLRF